jgi:hypothetical protein
MAGSASAMSAALTISVVIVASKDSEPVRARTAATEHLPGLPSGHLGGPNAAVQEHEKDRSIVVVDDLPPGRRLQRSAARWRAKDERKLGNVSGA